MKVTEGIWRISQEPGRKVRVTCLDDNEVLQPEDLCECGIGFHEDEHLEDLAIAILRFEKQKHELNKAINNL